MEREVKDGKLFTVFNSSPCSIETLKAVSHSPSLEKLKVIIVVCGIFM